MRIGGRGGRGRGATEPRPPAAAHGQRRGGRRALRRSPHGAAAAASRRPTRPQRPPTPPAPRPVPPAQPESPPPAPSTAYPTTFTPAGYVATDVGCAEGTSAPALDAFFRERIGPVLGLDYQHVYPLGGDRYLWLFQDTFIDHTGLATSFDQASFAHNTAMVQQGRCFTLLHRGHADGTDVVRARHRRAGPEPLVLAPRRRARRRSPAGVLGRDGQDRRPVATRRTRLGAGRHLVGHL